MVACIVLYLWINHFTFHVLRPSIDQVKDFVTSTCIIMPSGHNIGDTYCIFYQDLSTLSGPVHRTLSLWPCDITKLIFGLHKIDLFDKPDFVISQIRFLISQIRFLISQNRFLDIKMSGWFCDIMISQNRFCYIRNSNSWYHKIKVIFHIKIDFVISRIL